MAIQLAKTLDTHSLDGGQTDIHGPKGHPILGVLPELRTDPLSFALQASQQYGDIVPLRLGPKTVYMLNHPDYIRHVFQENRDNYVRSEFYEELAAFLGEGLFTLEGEKWKRQRSIAQKSVSGAMLKRMIDEIADATEIMIQRIDSKADTGESIDIRDELAHQTLDVVMRCFFNERLTLEEQVDVQNALSVILAEVERRIWRVLPVIEGAPTPRMRKVRDAVNTVDSLVYRIIRERIKRGVRHDDDDLLSMFIRVESTEHEGKSLEKVLRDQVVSFMLAGHETGSNSMTWAFYYLSKNPDLRRRHINEVDSVLQGRPVEFDDLKKLTFTNHLYEEVLRLCPPGWAYSREAIADDKFGDFELEAGSAVMLCAFAMHRNPRFWNNPEGFDPDRFDADCRPHPSDYRYFPFGGGAHMCMGTRFSMVEAGQTLSMLSQRYEFDLVGGQYIRPVAKTTIRPNAPVHMKVRRRDPAQVVPLFENVVAAE